MTHYPKDVPIMTVVMKDQGCSAAGSPGFVYDDCREVFLNELTPSEINLMKQNRNIVSYINEAIDNIDSFCRYVMTDFEGIMPDDSMSYVSCLCVNYNGDESLFQHYLTFGKENVTIDKEHVIKTEDFFANAKKIKINYDNTETKLRLLELFS